MSYFILNHLFSLEALKILTLYLRYFLNHSVGLLYWELLSIHSTISIYEKLFFPFHEKLQRFPNSASPIFFLYDLLKLPSNVCQSISSWSIFLLMLSQSPRIPTEFLSTVFQHMNSPLNSVNVVFTISSNSKQQLYLQKWSPLSHYCLILFCRRRK